MGVYIAMLIAAIVVAACMVGVLFWFFRRLNTIEKERWGDKK
ncbi:MAG: hypothetical protein QGH15_14310 [Kiritimatiellia bacterium]|jgi:hypothetical protein|nr:hypothetical protein [Kiritimatiellia bacterium]